MEGGKEAWRDGGLYACMDIKMEVEREADERTRTVRRLTAQVGCG